ncbi:hypothetical protein GCM10020000_13050 [Streptomyces olivoverticillatus]
MPVWICDIGYASTTSSRQRGPVLVADQGERRDRVDQRLTGLLTRQTTRERRDGAVFEDVRDRHVVTDAADRPDEAHGPEGVAAEVEEAVLGAHPLHAQDVRPDDRQALLDGRLRGHEPARAEGLAVRCRQRTVVDLAAADQRDGVEGDEGRRNHVGGQGGAQVLAQQARVGGAESFPTT